MKSTSVVDEVLESKNLSNGLYCWNENFRVQRSVNFIAAAAAVSTL